MLTVTSRDVQNRYGEFVESVQDDVVCVTRHGRPLFWAVSDRHLQSDSPKQFIGRLLLLHGQLRAQKAKSPGQEPGDLGDFLENVIDPQINHKGLSQEDVAAFVYANRR
jgi:prevent-host-death family protein